MLTCKSRYNPNTPEFYWIQLCCDSICIYVQWEWNSRPIGCGCPQEPQFWSMASKIEFVAKAGTHKFMENSHTHDHSPPHQGPHKSQLTSDKPQHSHQRPFVKANQTAGKTHETHTHTWQSYWGWVKAVANLLPKFPMLTATYTLKLMATICYQYPVTLLVISTHRG